MVTNKLTAAIFAEVILFAVALGAIFLYTLPGATVLIVFPQTRYNASARCFLVSVYQQPCQHTFQNTIKHCCLSANHIPLLRISSFSIFAPVWDMARCLCRRGCSFGIRRKNRVVAGRRFLQRCWCGRGWHCGAGSGRSGR